MFGSRHKDAVSAQRAYYRSTASRYDEMHLQPGDEHYFASSVMMGLLGFLGVTSLLDVGAGTGRTLLEIKSQHPGIRIVGVEPSAELRREGYAKGLLESELVDGDAQKLGFGDGAFDLVCEFAALHHIPDPDQAVSEMLRVAKTAVFISDSNNFGQGGLIARLAKQALNSVGLWKAADFVKTGGKRYSESEGDGIAYSYSVFNQYFKIRAACKSVHIINTVGAGINPYRSAGHVALLGLK